MKTVLRGKYIVLNAYIRKEEDFQLRKREKEKIKSRISRRKEIIIKLKTAKEKTNETKN